MSLGLLFSKTYYNFISKPCHVVCCHNLWHGFATDSCQRARQIGFILIILRNDNKRTIIWLLYTSLRRCFKITSTKLLIVPELDKSCVVFKIFDPRANSWMNWFMKWHWRVIARELWVQFCVDRGWYRCVVEGYLCWCFIEVMLSESKVCNAVMWLWWRCYCQYMCMPLRGWQDPIHANNSMCASGLTE